MWEYDVSLFASAVRPHLWPELLKSLEDNKRNYEIIFAGNVPPSFTHKNLIYIETKNIKPAQCYEIARRACRGELVGWIADDCRFSPRFIDKVYDFYKSVDSTYPIIVSCKTNENEKDEGMNHHRFFDRNLNTPKMAPLAIMTREYLECLGGIDSRYISGQYENDIVMRALSNGAKTYVINDVCVTIDHLKFHGVETKFWDSYDHDRQVLEDSWCIGGCQPNPEPIIQLSYKHSQPPTWYRPIKNVEVTLVRNDVFQSYPPEISLTESFGPKGIFD